MSALRKRIDWADDRGQGGWEVLPFGILVFVVGTLLIANLWAVIDAKMATNAAAREAARAVAEAPNETEASARSKQAAADAYAAFGREAGSRLDIKEPTYEGSSSGGFERCAVARVDVVYELPLVNLPLIGVMWGSGPVKIHGSHAEVIDPYSEVVETTEGGCL